MNTFDRINSLLKGNHKKQIDLTNYLGIPKAQYTDWKTGRTASYQKYLPQIADFFNVSVDYLLGKTEIKTPVTEESDELNEYLEQLKTRPEMRMLFSLAKGATKEDVEKAVAIIEALRKTDNG